MIIKNGRVFQEDGTFSGKRSLYRRKTFRFHKRRSDRSGSDRCERHDGSAGTG